MESIRELRRISGLTQAKTSRASGVNRAKLSLVECGEMELTATEDAAVRRVLLAAAREQAARIGEVLSGAESEPVLN